MEVFTFRDVDGKTVNIECLELYQSLQNASFMLFGVDMPSVLEFRKQYQLRHGVMPITKERIQGLFKGQ